MSYSLRCLLQTEGIGTIRSHQHGPEYEDDGLSSDEGQDGSTSDDEDDAEPKTATPSGDGLFVPGDRSASPEFTSTTPTPPSVTPTLPGRSFLPSIPKLRIRRSAQPPASADSSSTSIAASTPQSSSRSSVATPGGGKKKRLPGPWNGQKSDSYQFDAGNDIVGIVMLEIHGASDLPRLRNSEFCFYFPTPHQH